MKLRVLISRLVGKIKIAEVKSVPTHTHTHKQRHTQTKAQIHVQP